MAFVYILRVLRKKLIGVYMKLNKRILAIVSGAMLAFCATGCKLPSFTNANGTESSSISYLAFNNSASTTGEIIAYIQKALDNNEESCEIFVTDESLINAEDWLSSLSGLEQLSCEYRRVKNGYNLVVTFTRSSALLSTSPLISLKKPIFASSYTIIQCKQQSLYYILKKKSSVYSKKTLFTE